MGNGATERTVLETEVVRTTKSQRCWGCGNPIPPSEKVVGTKIKDESGEWVCYWCDVCHAYLVRHIHDQRFANGIGFKGIIKTDRSEWERVKAAMDSLSKGSHKNLKEIRLQK